MVSLWDQRQAVLGPNSERVAHDQTPQSRSSRVEFVTSSAGSYHVLANAYREGAGSYQLRLRSRTLTTGGERLGNGNDEEIIPLFR